MRWTTGRLVALLLALWIGALSWDYIAGQISDRKLGVPHVYTVVVFAIGITSFVGALNISRSMRGTPGRFEEGDVRFALAISFVAVFFALLSFYAFSRDEPTGFARSLIETFLDQTALVVGFYFATSGALEFVKIRERRRAGRDGDEGGSASSESPAQD